MAVPAQRKAGVIKSFVETEEGRAYAKEYELLSKQALLGRKYIKGLRDEVLRLSSLCDESLHEALKCSIETLDEAALLKMKTAFEDKLEALYPPLTQLRGRDDITDFDGDEYII